MNTPDAGGKAPMHPAILPVHGFLHLGYKVTIMNIGINMTAVMITYENRDVFDRTTSMIKI